MKRLLVIILAVICLVGCKKYEPPTTVQIANKTGITLSNIVISSYAGTTLIKSDNITNIDNTGKSYAIDISGCDNIKVQIASTSGSFTGKWTVKTNTLNIITYNTPSDTQ